MNSEVKANKFQAPENSVLDLNKAKILKMDKFNKLEYLDNLVICYPKMKEILDKMEECKLLSSYYNEPECLSLTGPTRTGKSKIVETFINKYPRSNDNNGTISTVLYCRLPRPATIGGIVTEFLGALGDPFVK